MGYRGLDSRSSTTHGFFYNEDTSLQCLALQCLATVGFLTAWMIYIPAVHSTHHLCYSIDRFMHPLTGKIPFHLLCNTSDPPVRTWVFIGLPHHYELGDQSSVNLGALAVVKFQRYWIHLEV